MKRPVSLPSLLRRALSIAFCIGPIWLVPASVDAAPARQSAATLAGAYDGGQMEMAVGLELMANGRFRYALSYGALDEEAAGTWVADGGQVLLTSDPVVPPRFVLVDRKDLPGSQLRVVLDVPKGMSRQYFHAALRFADGTTDERQLTDEQEPLNLEPGQRVTAVMLFLPVFDLRSAPVLFSEAGGHDLHFRFEPHDLGKVAFTRTPLRIDHGDLILSRYDRTITFRRTSRQEPGETSSSK